MYLLHTPWTRPETVKFSIAVSLVPWAALLGAMRLLTLGPISLEMGLMGGGFLAIGFTCLTALTVWLAGRLLRMELNDYFLILRKVLWAALPAGLVALFIVHLFPLNLMLVTAIQTAVLVRRLPAAQQGPADEAPRLEPIAFATVGIKFLIVGGLLFFALVTNQI
jgi:hypothetical protein